MNSSFWRSVASTLRFDYLDGACTQMQSGHDTTWRTLPYMVTAQVVDGVAYIVCEVTCSTRLEKGMAMLMPPGVRHRIVNGDADNVSRWSHVNFTVLNTVDLNAQLKVPIFLSGEKAFRLGNINEELAALTSNSQSLAGWLRHQSLCVELAALVAENIGDDGHGEVWQSEIARFLPVIHYIETHLDSNLDRAAMARLMRLSPSRFAAAFKAAFGMPPVQYRREVGMRHARQLLSTTTLGIAEIAPQCGFPNELNFSRAFKKRFGLSPGRFRQRGDRAF